MLTMENLKIPEFLSDPENVLVKLQILTNYKLNNEQIQAAKVHGLLAAAGSTPTLGCLHDVWSGNPGLISFAGAVKRRVLRAQ